MHTGRITIKKKRKKESGLLEWQDGEEGGLEVGRTGSGTDEETMGPMDEEGSGGVVTHLSR